MLAVMFAACLVVALAVMPADGWAAAWPQTVATSTEAQAGTPKTPQDKPAQPAAERQGRTRRSPRTSKRQPSSTRESLEQARTSRDRGAITQELTFSTNVLGGYDDNLTAGSGTGAGVVPAAIASGSTAFLDATLDYFRGNTRRSLRIESTGNLRAYPDYLDRPAAGGTFMVDARTTVGQKLTIAGSQRAGYEPFFSVVSPVAHGAPSAAAVGAAVPASGLFERRSLRSDTAMSIERQWSRRDATSLSYSYRAQRFTDDDDPGDSSSHEVQTEYRRRLARGAGVRAEYRFVNGEYTDHTGGTRPRREHRIEAGPEFAKALSRRRHVTLSASAGASSIESIGPITREPYHAWVPVGSASANIAVTSLWSVEGGYRRGFSLQQGITDEVYRTDTAYLTTGGLMTTRTDVRVGATYSNGKTAVSGVDGSFDVYGASLQTRVALTRTVAASAGYFFYHHHYSNPEALPTGFPAKYDRHAIRVGITVVVPLVGTSSRSPLNSR